MPAWNVRYYIDPETGLPHIHNHGVSEEEVEQVLAEPGEDRQGYGGAEYPLVGPGPDDICGSYTCLILSQAVCS